MTPGGGGGLAAAGVWDRWTGFQQAVGLMAQGMQRNLDPTGRVVSLRQPSAALLVRPPRVSAPAPRIPSLDPADQAAQRWP